MRSCLLGLTVLLLAVPAWAESGDSQRGFVFYERFRGSVNEFGVITRLDNSVGYNFNRHFGADVGLPVYFVRPSDSYAATLGAARNGIGNVYADLRFQAPNPAVNFASMLTATAPTGDQASGFSTGRATYDWTNHFDRSFGRLTPFANLGIANTISDTPFFIRPFSTLGFVGHFEGGAECRLISRLSVGASAYDLAPSGQQRIVSRVAQTKSPGGRAAAAAGKSSHRQPIETPAETVGGAGLASDHGFSTWVSLRPARYLAFEAGYSRSASYALDTVFFGVGLNVRSLAKEIKR